MVNPGESLFELFKPSFQHKVKAGLFMNSDLNHPQNLFDCFLPNDL